MDGYWGIKMENLIGITLFVLLGIPLGCLIYDLGESVNRRKGWV